jgi:hypothetical protein
MHPRLLVQNRIRHALNFVFGAVVLCGAGGLAWGQTPFLLQVQQGSSVNIVSNGATVTVAANGVGQPGSITLTATYQGTSTVLVSSAVISGSSDFSVMATGLPATLNPGNSVSIPVQYQPSSSSPATAQLTINYKEASVATGGTITLNLIGALSNLQVSYALQSDQNVVTLPSGGTVQFPPTLVNTNASATIIIANRGVGSGTVNSITISGAAFTIQSKPLLPLTVPAGVAVQFGIRYSPLQVGSDTGTLTIDLGGNTFQATLAGSGISARYSYQLLTLPNPTTITPNQTITIPDTNLGSAYNVTVQVQNTGAAAGTIGLLSVTGAGFSLTDTPPLPATLNPNDILVFTLNFQPIQPGAIAGRLRVGNDQFPLAAMGLGAKLTYSYVSGTTVTVVPGGQVVFNPTQVGQTSQLAFTISNAGTTAATVSSISVSDTHGVFRLEKLPPSPLTLNPGDSSGFTIDFSPAATGSTASTLQIDAQTFTLTGPGTPPPVLPNVQFSGPTGNVNPSAQLPVGLSIVATYPVTVSGVLTMTYNGTLPADPAAQFATGGRAVNFTIPANTLQAVFANQGNQVSLQTGTTAGTITLTPTFATQSGAPIDTSSPAALALTVPAAAPRIVSVQSTNITAQSFTLVVKGFSTTHSLTKLNLQFTAASDVKIGGGPISVDLSSAAVDWYNSSQSANFGGQFSVTLPFTLQSSVSSPTSKIQGVSVTAVNDQGTSAAFTTTIP